MRILSDRNPRQFLAACVEVQRFEAEGKCVFCNTQPRRIGGDTATKLHLCFGQDVLRQCDCKRLLETLGVLKKNHPVQSEISLSSDAKNILCLSRESGQFPDGQTPEVGWAKRLRWTCSNALCEEQHSPTTLLRQQNVSSKQRHCH